MENKLKKIFCIGGSMIDSQALPDKEFINGVSNPGRIKSYIGGVMYNVVSNLVYFNDNSAFLTFIGNDINGRYIKDELNEKRSLNVNFIPYIEVIPNYSSSAYIYFNDYKTHDLMGAIVDTKIFEGVSNELLSKYVSIIKDYDYLIIDTNLSINNISYLIESLKPFDIRICVDLISPLKAFKYKDFLNDIYLLKTNFNEAYKLVEVYFETKNIDDYAENERLAFNEFKNNKDITSQELASILFVLGVKNVVITNKDLPIGYASKLGSGSISFTSLSKEEIVNTTGCGDAFLAGFVHSYMQNEDLVKAIKDANECSSMTLKSDEAVNRNINEVFDKMRQN